MDRSSEMVSLSLELTWFDLIINSKFGKLIFWRPENTDLHPSCGWKRLKSGFWPQKPILRKTFRTSWQCIWGVWETLWAPEGALGSIWSHYASYGSNFRRSVKNIFFEFLKLKICTFPCFLSFPKKTFTKICRFSKLSLKSKFWWTDLRKWSL